MINKRNSNRRSPQPNPQPEPNTPERGANVVDLLPERVTVTDREGGKGNKRGFLTAVKSADQARLDAKARLLGTVSQKLAEAKDLYSEGEDQAVKVSAIVNEVGLALYQARVRGIVGNDDVSTLLGNQFGFKMKGDAKRTVPSGHKDASKTPAGNGEAIRKRIVRAVQAYEYVNQNASNAFFDGIPTDDVKEVLTALPHPNDDGQWVTPPEGEAISLWAAYDQLAEAKRAAAEGTVNPAFNFRRIAALNAALEEDITASVAMFKSTPGLTEAYAALMNTLAAIDEAGADEEKAA